MAGVQRAEFCLRRLRAVLRSQRILLFALESDAKMYHMKKATIRDLRYRFREVENLLREGEEIEITKRKRVIARLLPSRGAVPVQRPDFLARLKRIYGSNRTKVSGADLIARERDRY